MLGMLGMLQRPPKQISPPPPRSGNFHPTVKSRKRTNNNNNNINNINNISNNK